MEYKTELPKRYKTWVEFYDDAKKYVDIEKADIIVLIEEKEIDCLLHWKTAPDKIDFPKEMYYSIRMIKDNALEELLSERMEREEIETFIKETFEFMVSGFKEIMPEHVGIIKRVKRILLTSKKEKDV